MNALDILAARKADKAERFTRPPASNLSAISIAWKNMLGDRSGVVRDLTGKERGQLGRLIRKVNAACTAMLVYGACRDWNSFAEELQRAGITKGRVTEPSLGMLLEHCDVGLRLAAAGWPDKSTAEIANEAAATEADPWAGMKS